MGLQDQIRRLFETTGESSWWRDGVFCDQMWESSPLKVLFLLKEPNGSGVQYASLVESEGGVAHEPGWQGWIEIGRWAHAITCTTESHTPDYDECETHETLADGVSRVCAWKLARHRSGVMNLKKEPGASVVQSYDVLRNWALSHRPFLLEQMRLMNPDVVVFCGDQVWEIASEVFDLPGPRGAKKPYFVSSGRLWIDFIHYRARYSVFASYYALVGIMRAALSKPEVRALFNKDNQPN